MKYEKPIMCYAELHRMGFPEQFLDEVIACPGQTIAWKSGMGSRSRWLFDIEEFEKYRKKRCSGRR